jgi:hypothetical protein
LKFGEGERRRAKEGEDPDSIYYRLELMFDKKEKDRRSEK